MKNININDEKLLRDVAVLSRLKDQEDYNFKVLVTKIKARRYRRIFMRLTLSSAAVAILALVFTFSFSNTSFTESALDTLDSPMLITESGEKIVLADEYSYTLDLKTVVSRSDNVSASPAKKTVSENKNLPVNKSSDNVLKNTVVIPRGFTYDIKFDDGSEAHLNSGSYIEFPKSFENKSERVVLLDGEGYFKVAKMDKPFMVKTNSLEIIVYGTEFNVNSNKEGRVETLLVSGSVGVKSQETSEEIILYPNDMLVYNLEGKSVEIKEVIPNDYLAWMNGDFTCTSQPLFYLIDEISAFYGITIDKDPALDNQLITISLSRHLGYRQIMEILSQAIGLEFERVDKQTYICKQIN